MKRTRRRFAYLFLVPALLPALSLLAANEAPVIYTARVDAIIQPVTAEYMVSTIDRADAANAEAVIFVLETPGGLVDSTRTIITRMLSSKTPVVVFVGPAGARAASAGFLITIAADVAVVSPGTHIGAAHPVSGEGEKLDETMSKKVEEDLAAYARTITEKRGRNVMLADQAVRQSRAFTDEEALAASPPLVDFRATDVGDVIAKLDGRTVRRFAGSTVVLHTADARVVAVDMSAIAHPNITYLLFSLGVLGLTIELWNPGSVLPGVVGGICLLLAFYSFQVLPVNYAGMLLILFGIGLFVLELKVPSYGLLSAGGIISLLFGSLMLMGSSSPELRVSLSVVLPVVFALSAIMMFLVRLTVLSQRRRSVTGSAGMLDELGRALTPIRGGEPGRVATHGEIWRAVSLEPIARGETVRVTRVDGLTLTVRREAGASPPAAGDEPDVPGRHGRSRLVVPTAEQPTAQGKGEEKEGT
jgi:membrane-bound serine protease (ClpP class)